MSKRLYDIARELDISSNELVRRIESAELSFDVHDHLTVLTDGQVGELMRAFEAAPATERIAERVQSGVIRRRTRKKDDEVEVAVAPAPAAAPTAPAAAAAPAEAEPSPGVAPRRRLQTVVTRPAEEVAPKAAPSLAEEPAPVAAPEPTPDAAPAAPRPRFATVVTREVDAPAAAAVAAPAAPRSRFATVITSTRGESTVPAQVSADELAAVSSSADARAAARGGAKVVGSINPDLLTNRLEADKKDFGPRRPGTPAPAPGPGRDRAEADRKKGGKRVVQSRDLYDKGKPGRPGTNRKGGKGSAPVQATKITQAAEHKRVVRMEESIAVSDLAHQMSVKAGEIAMKLMFELGIRGANINTLLDFDTAQLLAEMYEYRVEQVGFDITKYLPSFEDATDEATLRPPVVTVMGHVDHGKTSLLDAIRNATVAQGEAGGITQHIGAYQVDLGAKGKVTFLDTPGHEAFTALRARGAKATDIAILVVAADDGVMPQTVEALNHAKDAGVPIIVAVNKCDKENANPDRVRHALAEYQLIPEEWGGSTIFVNVSALTHVGIDTLLEMVHLQAEVMELRAHFDRTASGLVIESKLDVGRGPVATVLVQDGTLKRGDIVVVGEFFGRVRTMTDERNSTREVATPAVPVELTGLNGVPAAGEHFHVVEDVDRAKAIAEHISKQNRQSQLALSVAATGGMDALGAFMRSGEIKELKVIVKGDVQGSVEAVVAALSRLSTEKVTVKVIHSAVGAISESDVNLAASSEEGVRVVIVGFNVRPDNRAAGVAEQLGVKTIIETVIYEIIDRVRLAMTGMLEPVFREEPLGKAEVRALFNVPKLGTVAGCMVIDGLIQRNARCRLTRGGKVLIESAIGSLRHFEKNVQEVKSGFECGLSVERADDVKVGDIVECYRLVETAATL
ncbi:MAG: translation initiation factor IF-2 [Myxococcales bacterium]|nr:translation initiation factor IF-2 [Myxococcales bacterium]